jgi:hypothetical protein
LFVVAFAGESCFVLAFASANLLATASSIAPATAEETKSKNSVSVGLLMLQRTLVLPLSSQAAEVLSMLSKEAAAAIQACSTICFATRRSIINDSLRLLRRLPILPLKSVFLLLLLLVVMLVLSLLLLHRRRFLGRSNFMIR